MTYFDLLIAIIMGTIAGAALQTDGTLYVDLKKTIYHTFKKLKIKLHHKKDAITKHTIIFSIHIQAVPERPDTIQYRRYFEAEYVPRLPASNMADIHGNEHSFKRKILLSSLIAENLYRRIYDQERDKTAGS